MTSPISNNHPISPPPELIQQWWDDIHGASYEFDAVVTQATRWGADQELEACCEWLFETGYRGTPMSLRAVRRPKPPSLKEKALKALDSFEGFTGSLEEVDVIRHALEQLND